MKLVENLDPFLEEFNKHVHNVGGTPPPPVTIDGTVFINGEEFDVIGLMILSKSW